MCDGRLMRYSSISTRTNSRAPAQPSIMARSRTARNAACHPAISHENADQHGHDDDPAQHADLRQASGNRGIALPKPAPMAFLALPYIPQERIGFLRLCHVSIPAPRPSPRKWRTIWRMAFNCRRACSTCSTRSASRSPRKRARTSASRVARLSPSTPSRVATAMSWPPVTAKIPGAPRSSVSRRLRLPAHHGNREGGHERRHAPAGYQNSLSRLRPVAPEHSRHRPGP